MSAILQSMAPLRRRFSIARRNVAEALMRVLAIVVVSLATIDRASPGETEPVPEYNVKAGYLLLFARYVYWPETAFASPDSPLVIALLGDDPFGAVLDETLRDQRVGTHPVRVMHATAPEEAMRAHVVFVAQTHRSIERRWWAALKGRPILGVGESAESLDAGAAIRLLEDRGTIRFDIDWRTAAAAGIRIASPMIVSARRVRGAPADGPGRVPTERQP